MDHFFRGSGCFFWISYKFNEVVIVSVSGSFCIMLSKRETAGAERKSFSGSTPIPVGMVWIGLVWYYLPWHAVACGRIQTQDFPFRQDFKQHIVPRSYKQLYFAFCSVFTPGGQIIRLNGKNASQRILMQNRGYLQSVFRNSFP